MLLIIAIIAVIPNYNLVFKADTLEDLMKRQSPAKGSVAKRAKSDASDKENETENAVDAKCSHQEMIGNKFKFKKGMYQVFEKLGK